MAETKEDNEALRVAIGAAQSTVVDKRLKDGLAILKAGLAAIEKAVTLLQEDKDDRAE